MGKKAPERGKCMQGWSTGSVGAPEHASVAHQKLILVFGVRTELPEASGGGVRSGRSTGVTGDVTVVPAGSEARAVPTPTQSSHRDRLDARGERLRAGQNKYYLAYAQSLHTEAFWRPSVSSEKP